LGGRGSDRKTAFDTAASMIAARRAVYFGRTAEIHVEHFPE
jgi:hypothetical protein